MKNYYIKRNILCIDLKSFFASAECVERKLDPFKTPLVVADITKGNGTITLAVTPYLKKLGVKSRGRVYEIPDKIKKQIIFAKPRMNLYYQKSKEIIDIYLQYISYEDMHVYSIDEVFLDVTDYLKFYNKSDYELALEIMKKIKDKTGITSTCGIGPNLLLAKISLDIESKHNKNCIAKWGYEDIKTKLHNITPLSEFWGIGKQYEKKLNNLGIKKIGDINKYPISFYKKRFGIMGEELWYHANGIDLSNIKKEKISPKDKSYSMSQVFYKDYTPEKTILIIKEMTEILCKRIRENKKTCKIVSLGITYSKNIGGYFYHSRKLDIETDDNKTIYEMCLYIFNNYVNNLPIRKVSISLGNIQNKKYKQINLFEKIDDNPDELSHTLDKINTKFGNNAVLKASSLVEYSTIKNRNKKLGGHNKE